MTDILPKVQSIIAETLIVDASQVVPSARFTDDLGADSLDFADLLLSFKQEFGVEVDESAALQVRTVQDAVDYIEKQLGSNPS